MFLLVKFLLFFVDELPAAPAVGASVDTPLQQVDSFATVFRSSEECFLIPADKDRLAHGHRSEYHRLFSNIWNKMSFATGQCGSETSLASVSLALLNAIQVLGAVMRLKERFGIYSGKRFVEAVLKTSAAASIARA